jgi:RNA polymerase sigma factor (sigma-70 family)
VVAHFQDPELVVTPGCLAQNLKCTVSPLVSVTSSKTSPSPIGAISMIESESDLLTTDPTGPGDQELLREYAASQSEEAFAGLTRRHLDWVHAAALRQTGSYALAQDVTQAVFIVLARKAASLSRETVLSGWLFRAVRYAVLDTHKLEKRRQLREQEAAQMEQTHSAGDSQEAWEQMAPVLDEAMSGLGEKDRHAVLLRFFEKKSFGEIGAVLGGNENSARVRVVRAVEKLRAFFQKRGVTLSVVTISGLLFSNATLAAPAGVAASVAALVRGTTGIGALELLIRCVTQRLFQPAIRWVLLGLLLLLLMLGGNVWLGRLREVELQRAQVARQAEQAAIAQQARAAVAAIDRALWLNQADRLEQMFFFRPEDASSRQVMLAYLRSVAAFRESLEKQSRGRTGQNRSFTAALNELLAGQPKPRTSRTVLTATRATDDSFRSHTVVLTNVAGSWKWDWLDALAPEIRRERVTVLQQKTAWLEGLIQQLREGMLTNADEAVRFFKEGPARR